MTTHNIYRFRMMPSGLILGWSSCQADYYSSEDEEESNLSDEEKFSEDDFILSSESEEEHCDTGKTNTISPWVHWITIGPRKDRFRPKNYLIVPLGPSVRS